MMVIGLTGGIGSGKSSTANYFADLGVPIIDSDILAREVTEKESPAWQKIINHFGNEITQADGSLDRRKLREIIFNDSSKKLWLEKLLHPLIIKAIEDQLSQVKSPYCIVVIPLLVETGPYPFLNRVLLVDAPELTQIERLKARDQSSAENIQKIIRSQADRQARIAAADDIIINDGDLTHLTEQVTQLHQQYLRIAQ